MCHKEKYIIRVMIIITNTKARKLQREREREKESVCDMKGELYYYGQPSVFECVLPV